MRADIDHPPSNIGFKPLHIKVMYKGKAYNNTISLFIKIPENIIK